MNSNNNNSNNVRWSRNRINENTVMPTPNNKYSTQQGGGMQTTVSHEMPLQQTTEMTDTMDYMSQQGPPPVMDRSYIPGYLANNIGKYIRAEFLIGNNTFLDKAGRLVEVGVNYFVIEDFISRAKVMCDLYSVRFVTFNPQSLQ